jgi:hypothetical protein
MSSIIGKDFINFVKTLSLYDLIILSTDLAKFSADEEFLVVVKKEIALRGEKMI